MPSATLQSARRAVPGIGAGGPTAPGLSSSGNFGQGMAYAARQRGLALTVFANAPANPLKVARMRALGADVRVTGGDSDEAHPPREDSRPRTARC